MPGRTIRLTVGTTSGVIPTSGLVADGLGVSDAVGRSAGISRAAVDALGLTDSTSANLTLGSGGFGVSFGSSFGG